MWHTPGDPATDEDSLPSIEALTIEPDRGSAEVRDEVRHLLGIGARRDNSTHSYASLASP